MPKRRSFIGSRSGKGNAFFNPADLFQLGRRLGARPNKTAGYGFYQGKPEMSMGFTMNRTQQQKTMNIANQQSVYSTSGIQGKGWNMKTNYLLSIKIFGARRLLQDQDFSRDIYRYNTLQTMISNAKSKTYLFDGGTIFENGNDIEIQSAFFGNRDELKNMVYRMKNFVNKLQSIGVSATYRVIQR